MWNFIQTEFDGLTVIEPSVYRDSRGYFFESYNQKEFYRERINVEFIQDNHSFSNEIGVIRGLHYQENPKAQSKLVRVVTGSIYDVAVDLRTDSKTFGKWFKVILSENNMRQLFIPEGFAHGFCTLSKNTNVLYKTNEFYSPRDERGIYWGDPSLKIDWPTNKPIISEKDQMLPLFKDIFK